jgi:hypothetical protein
VTGRGDRVSSSTQEMYGSFTTNLDPNLDPIFSFLLTACLSGGEYEQKGNLPVSV